MRSRVTAKGSGHRGLPVRPQQGASSQSVPFGCPYSAEEGPCAVPQPVAGALQPVYTHRARHVARSGLGPCSGPEEWTGRSGCRGEGRWPGGTSSRGLGHKRTRARNPVSPPRPQRPWPLRSLAVHTGAASTAPPTGTSAGTAGPGPVLFATPRSLHGLLPLPRTRFPPPPACLWLSATFTSLSFHCPSATPRPRCACPAPSWSGASILAGPLVRRVSVLLGDIYSRSKCRLGRLSRRDWREWPPEDTSLPLPGDGAP